MRRRLTGGLAAACLLALSVATAATAAPGDIARLTLDTGGTDPSDSIVLGSLVLSDDGDLVAFESVANDLVSGDADDGTFDVFLRDLTTDATEFGNLDSMGAKADGLFSGDPALSGDGSTLAFYSDGTNLDAGDGGATQDVFVRDLTGTTTARFSIDSGGSDPDAASEAPELSEDGSGVVFASIASDLFPFAGDVVGTSDIVFRDGFTNRLMSAIDGTDDSFSDGSSFNPAISEDVGAIAFESEATDLIGPGADTNGTTDVFVRDVALETTERVSISDGEAQSDGFSGSADISANGARVVFASSAVLAPGGSPDGRGTYVRDRSAGTTERVDVSWSAVHDDSNEIQLDAPTISDDGRYVAFASDSAELVPNDTNGTTDVFVRDLAEDRMIRVSVRSTGAQTNRRSLTGTISGDGSLVAFASEDNGLVPGDTTDPNISMFFEAFAVEPEWVRPDTTVTAPPPATTTATQVQMSFSSEPNSSFLCRVDGGAFDECSSPYTTAPLPLGAHSVEVAAVDRFGNVDDTPASSNFVVQQAPGQQQPPPEPTFQQDFNLEPVSGKVFVTLPDGRRFRLEDLTNIPTGSIIDARNGTVRLFVEGKNGKIESSTWTAGVFKVVQLANGITECRLVGPLRPARAGAAAASADGPVAQASARRRRLWGNGRGRFRSRGKHSSATVRGTKWLVEDRPNGTLTLVRRGSVTVRDFVRKRTVIVKKGQRYFAKKTRRSRRSR